MASVTSVPHLFKLGTLPDEWLIEYMQLLNTFLIALQQAYYYGTSTCSDADYDRMFLELKALETEFPQFADPNSVINLVGG